MLQQFFRFNPVSGKDVGNDRLPDGQRPGFVKGYDAGMTGCFENVATAKQDAVCRSLAGADKNSGRCCQAKCARAGNDQNCHSVQCGSSRVTGQECPGTPGRRSDQDNDWHKI